MSDQAGIAAGSSFDAPKKVPRRPLDSSNPRLADSVPIVGLGCSSFSNFFWSDGDNAQENVADWTPEKMDRSHARVREWIEAIRHAISDCGITLLDTAPWYGHGTSEVIIGWALEEQQAGPRDGLVINTKVGRYEAEPSKQFDFSKDATIHSVERSLRRMKCHYIDVLQLHDPEFAPSLELLLDETIPAMMMCRERGYCRALGMTGYPLEVQHQILEASMERFGRSVWDQSLTYSHYCLHDNSLFAPHISYMDDRSFADYCQAHSIVLLAAAPLSMGLLTHAGPPSWHPAPQDLQDACRQAAAICKEHGVNISTLALVFALSQPKIPCTLLGMKNKTEVQAAAQVALRFEKVDPAEVDAAKILDQVLTAEESKVLRLLEDQSKGPFASVWKKGLYKWDGLQEVQTFWAQVDGANVTQWQRR